MNRIIEEQIRLLLCEDDVALGSLLADYLRRLNFEVDLCDNGEAAKASCLHRAGSAAKCSTCYDFESFL